MKSTHPISRIHAAQALAPSLPARRQVLLGAWIPRRRRRSVTARSGQRFREGTRCQRGLGFGVQLNAFGRLASLGQGIFPLAALAAAIQQVHWTGWIENEEKRAGMSKIAVRGIAPGYKAMREAFQP